MPLPVCVIVPVAPEAFPTNVAKPGASRSPVPEIFTIPVTVPAVVGVALPRISDPPLESLTGGAALKLPTVNTPPDKSYWPTPLPAMPRMRLLLLRKPMFTAPPVCSIWPTEPLPRTSVHVTRLGGSRGARVQSAPVNVQFAISGAGTGANAADFHADAVTIKSECARVEDVFPVPARRGLSAADFEPAPRYSSYRRTDCHGRGPSVADGPLDKRTERRGVVSSFTDVHVTAASSGPRGAEAPPGCCTCSWRRPLRRRWFPSATRRDHSAPQALGAHQAHAAAQLVDRAARRGPIKF